MNSYSKKILKHLNKVSTLNNPVSLEDISKNIKFTKDEIEQALTDLEENNLIIQCGYSFYADNELQDNLKYYSSNNGKDYFKIQRINYFAGCFQTGVVPALISLAVTLLTNLLPILIEAINSMPQK